MSVLLLIRHGQASFGAADYDQLSPLGQTQSARLATALGNRSIVATRVVCGSLKRHVQTAEHAGLGSLVVDPGWDEFDDLHVLGKLRPPSPDELTERGAYQAWFQEGTRRWVSGDFDDEYEESFPAFSQRVDGALRRAVAGLGSGEAGVVFTSGGPIGAVVSALLGGRSDLWQRLNLVTVNTGITKVVIGSRGMTLLSFNDHGHLEPHHVSYR